MNIINTVQTGFSARLFAGITIVSLLLSAFPVAFFVAEAQGPDSVNICKANQSEAGFVAGVKTVNSNSINTGLANSGLNGDIVENGQNWTETYPNGFTGEDIFGAGCNYVISESISGTKYNDLGNDAAISGDAGIEAWEIRLYKVENEWVLASTTLTDENGDYDFGELTEGTYKVCELLPENWSQTFVSNGSTNESPNASEEGPECQTVNVDKLIGSNTVNFGNYYEEEVVKTAETIVVTGNTISPAGGWWFGRDQTTATPFEFNADTSVIGDGALFVPAIGSNPSDKFIAEYFMGNRPVEEFESLAYSFQIDGNGTAGEANEFYTNIHANFPGNEGAFGDCKFDYVPTTGIAGDFVEFNIDATDTPSRVRGDGCPSTLAEMPAGSTIFFFALNVGDTAATDEGLAGYYDKVVLTTTDKVTTYDFEPLPVVIPGCTDDSATNYDPEATEDDSSCVFPFVSQCIDATNLLTNGSFEEPEVTLDRKWQKMSTVPGWDVTKVSNGTPTTLELMENIFGNEAADGDQYAELDGDHSTKVTQTAATVERATYELSWAFAGRHNAGGDNQNQLGVSVDGSPVATEGPQTDAAGLEVEDWTIGSYVFEAASDATEIAFADLGPSNSFGTYLDNAQLCLVADPEPIVTISTTKIVCDYESELPNWSGKVPGDLVTADTAANWLAEQGKDTTCRVVEDWEFEWAASSAKNPGNSFVGAGGSDWTTFSGSTEVPLSEVNSRSFWVREVLPAEYIPFGGSNSRNDVSAEMYCHKDGLNYDNFDRIDRPQADETYHCVAWNVPKELPPQTCSIYSDTQTLVEDTNEYAVETYVHNNWTEDIDGAAWVWATEQVENPTTEEVYTFIETFTVENPSAATLEVAADNLLLVTVNGTVVLDQRDQNNFVAPQTVDILPALNATGSNIIEFEVTNLAGADDYQRNPAGVLYRIDITSPVACEVTTEPVPPASLVITNPATPGLTLSGVYDFTAEYVDNDSEVDFIEWAIRAGTCDSSTSTVAGNIDGFSIDGTLTGNDFSTIVDMSTWANGDYCFVVNPDENNDVPGEADLSATQTFILDNTTDPEPETVRITGTKFELGDDFIDFVSGWTIELYNLEGFVASTTTNTNGEYYFDVEPGYYEVHEVMREDWVQTDVAVSELGTVSVDLDVNHCVFDMTPEDQDSSSDDSQAVVYSTYNCSFTNEQVTEEVEPTPATRSGSSRSSGTRTNRSLAPATPAPLVAGVQTSQCPFLTDHMQMGWDNDRMEVMKLQLFLNIFKDLYGGTENPVTGNFGIITDTNVKTFQNFFKSEVLNPWYEEGIVGHTKPTGFVYKTTLWKINDIVCGAIFPSLEGENLETNVDLNANAIQD